MLTIIALFGHWFADFVCQDDGTAKNKSTNNVVMAKHCLSYTMWLFLVLMPFLIYSYNISKELIVTSFLIVLFSHVIIDVITSRLNSYLWKTEQRHWFFVSIGFDQFLHISILLGSLGLLK